MKASGLINIGILPLLLEAMTPIYAQHDQREQEPRHPNQREEARPERPQPGSRREREPRRAERPAQQPRPPGREEQRRPERPTPERRPQPARLIVRRNGSLPAVCRSVNGCRARSRHGNSRRLGPRRRPGARTKASTGARGPNIARTAGRPSTAAGSNGEGYRGPNPRMIATVVPSGEAIGSGCTDIPCLVVSGYPRFQFGGFWFGVLIDGRNTGLTTGMAAMTCTLTCTEAATTCGTACTPSIGWRSRVNIN